jgi:hypothetical protein
MHKARHMLAAGLGASLVVSGLWWSLLGRPSPLERRVRDAAENVLAADALRGSRLVAVHCGPTACELEAVHDDRAALASFQQQFPHRMGAIFRQSSIRSDRAALRSHVRFSRKGEQPAD